MVEPTERMRKEISKQEFLKPVGNTSFHRRFHCHMYSEQKDCLRETPLNIAMFADACVRFRGDWESMSSIWKAHSVVGASQ